MANKINCPADETKAIFLEKEISYKEQFHAISDGKIRSVSTGNIKSKRLICFLHGAPGAWNAFSEYLEDKSLRSAAQLVAIDRIGYGSSNYGEVENDIQAHTEGLHTVLNAFDFDSLYLIGHSFGGPIAGNYAANFPEKLVSVLMIAPVINPYEEKEFWFNHILKQKFISWMLPAYVNVSVQEKLNHASALEKIESSWDMIKTPIIHMHCKDDWIAPARPNLDFSEKHISKDFLKIMAWEGDGHLIPFNNFEKVKITIFEMLNH